MRGGWSGFGTDTVGIDPNTFEVLNGHPNKIPTDKILGGVVQNCRGSDGTKLPSLRCDFFVHSALFILFPFPFLSFISRFTFHIIPRSSWFTTRRELAARQVHQISLAFRRVKISAAKL